MILFLIIPLILLTINIYLYINKNIVSSYFISIAAWSLLLLVSTEALSLFKALNYTTILLFWIILSVILIIPIIIKKDKKASFKDLLLNIKDSFKGNKFFILFIIIFSIGMIWLAVKTEPYNWDSMTYHLSRIMHWDQNQSVAHYATNISRQLASPPLAEFINLHVYKLSGNSDIFFNLLQCASFLTCGFIVFKIAKKVGCSSVWAKIAAILLYAIPIAFAEAVTTQVDNLATMYFLIFIYFILDFMKKDNKLELTKENVFKIITLGLCLGLCYISKPTVMIAAALFTLYLIFMCIRRKDKFKRVIISIMIVIFSAGFVVSPEILRNYKTYDSISSSSVGAKQIVGTSEFKYVLVNFCKNIAFNLPTRYFDKSTDFIINTVYDIAKSLDVNINAEVIAENGMVYRAYSPSEFGHDSATNPLIVWLLIITIIFGILYYIFRLIIRKRLKLGEIFGSYYFLSFLSFLVLMVIMRWEIWETRYEIANLALLCPATCLVFSNIFKDKKECGQFAAGIIFIICIYNFYSMSIYHLDIAMKTRKSPNAGYFYYRTKYKQPYFDLTDIIKEKNYKSVGLKIGEDDFEYPLWVLLSDSVDSIEHIAIDENQSDKYEKNQLPDCIIYIDHNGEEDIENYQYRDHTYNKVTNTDKFYLFEK